ncbi:MAG: hypothetical protein IH914_02260 [candidate division Zixibacteria bacterium]|nr:hypothetical protein [candidate division Zixibacteria bacterium]
MRITGKKFKTIVVVSAGSLVFVGLALTNFASSVTPQESSPNVKNVSSAGGPAPSASAIQPASQSQSSAQSAVIYKDPATGKIIQTPASGYPRELAEQMKEALSTSSAGLVEQQSPVSGIYVNLNGRFRSLMAASESTEGVLQIGCQSAGEGQILTEEVNDTKEQIKE